MFDQWVAELPTSSLRYCRSPVTRAEMTMSHKEDLQIDAFVAHWRKTGCSELAHTQSFINGLCNLLGLEPPAGSRTDDAHTDFVFERRVFQDTGVGTQRLCRIHCYQRDCCIVEAKTGSELGTAHVRHPVPV